MQCAKVEVMAAKFLPHSAAMAQQWEIAKGHLRAVAALSGGVNRSETNYDATQGRLRYEVTRDTIENFISRFERDGLEEGID